MFVGVTRRAAVAVVELRRPDRRNAVGPAMAEELERRLGQVGNDDRIRAVVLAGARKSFCAGADMKERLEGPAQSSAVLTAVRRASASLAAVPVPVIGVAHGHALGAGLELLATCDYRVAEEGASLGLPEVRLGMVSGGGILALASLVPRGTLARLAFGGAAIDAAEACAAGIVDEVVGKGEGRRAALALAGEFADQPRPALVATKAAVRASAQPMRAQQWDLLGLLQSTMEGGAAQRARLDQLRPMEP